MATLGTLVGVLLALVLLAAAVAKSVDSAQTTPILIRWRDKPRSFTLPRWTIVILETVIALLFLFAPQPVGYVSLASMAVLFIAYTFASVLLLTSYEPVSCRCFGALTPGRLTNYTVGRNAALAGLAVAALVVYDEETTTIIGFAYYLKTLALRDWMAIGLAVAVLFQLFSLILLLLVKRALESGGTVSKEPVPVPTAKGSRAPHVSLRDTKGNRRSTRELVGKPALLLFVDEACPECMKVLEHVPEWIQRVKNAANLLVVYGGVRTSPLVIDEVTRLAAAGVLVWWHETADDVYRPFGIRQLPSCVAITERWTVASEWAEGRSRVQMFISGFANGLQGSKSLEQTPLTAGNG